ncbi:UNKNOWN [Stylonychia lemnae]|uniref:Transmembrane protein n=1 Tax=Stylonychia lemnae TaxID=5949 RepID=A0A077ZUL0_STYLE|nr:UNKNOWN [Stylonychia lemnae]|eukprot:CDW73572.1 UNKNOWN [Stylonychia lemnae]
MRKPLQFLEIYQEQKTVDPQEQPHYQDQSPPGPLDNTSLVCKLRNLLMSLLTLLNVSIVIAICTFYQRVYGQRREEFENKSRITTKLILVEAFAVLNVYYLDISRKRRQNLGDTENQDMKFEAKVQKIKRIIYHDVTRDCCLRENINMDDYTKWGASSQDGKRLKQIINKSLKEMKKGIKPSIDYDINSKITPAVLNSIYQKLLAFQRYSTLKIIFNKMRLLNERGQDKQKLSEEDKNEIMIQLQKMKPRIIREVAQLYDVCIKGENPSVTIKKAFNKYFFDKTWYEEILKVYDEHYKQMAILINYGDKTKITQTDIDTIRSQNPMKTKDPQLGSKLIYQIIKSSESLSNETIEMITGKFKMNYVKPPKLYVLKLQRIKDKMAYALRSKLQNLQAKQQDESPSRYQSSAGPQTVKSQKSTSQRKDSNSSLNTIQPNKSQQNNQAQQSIEAYLAAKTRQSMAKRIFTQNQKYAAIFKSDRSSVKSKDQDNMSVKSGSTSNRPIEEERYPENESSYNSKIKTQNESSSNIGYTNIYTNTEGDENQSTNSDKKEVKMKIADQLKKMLEEERLKRQQERAKQ